MFNGCEKKMTDVEFEQSVFDEIFLKIVDSTYIDQRIYSSFPDQGKPIYDKNGKWIGLDTVGQYQRDIKHQKEIAKFKKDTLGLVIAIENKGLINENTNLDKYKSSKFIFKHLSEIPRDHNLEYSKWKTKYAKFAGAMMFSNIIFDAKKSSGVIDVSYSCGGKCGQGFIVTIKKVNKKWMVSKIQEAWIS